MVARVAGLVAIWGFLLYYVQPGLSAMYSTEGIAIVGGMTVAGWIAATGPRTNRVFRIVREARGSVSAGAVTPAELRLARRVLRTARHSALVGGFLCTLWGMILMMRNLNDPAQIGPGMSLALTPMLYGVVLAYFLLLPLEARVERRLAEQGEGVEQAETSLDLLLLVGCCLLSGLSMAILLTAFGY